MDDSRNFNLDQMMEHVRLKVRENRQKAASAADADANEAQRRLDWIDLDRAHDLGRVSMNPNRKFMGRTILRAANVVRGLLVPIIRTQSQYNAANTRLTGYLKNRLDWMGSQHAELRSFIEQALARNTQNLSGQFRALANRLARSYAADIAMHAQSISELTRRVAAMEQQQSGWVEQLRQLVADSRQERQQIEELAEREQRMAGRFTELDNALEAVRSAHSQAHSQYQQFKLATDRAIRAERRLRRFLDIKDSNGASTIATAPDADDSEYEIDYAGFEDRLRDSAMVSEKQRSYVKHFAGKAPVIDMGCGKGEFLELLREAGVAAKGVDLDLDMVLLCKDKGLDVEQCGAIEYLGRQEDGSVGGIFSAPVIEHLTSLQLNTVLNLAWRKLAPGGTIVLETLNPESLFVHFKWFWMDPSHVRLVHPQTLQYLLESAGFSGISCVFIQPPAKVPQIPPLQGSGLAPLDEFNEATDFLNRLLYGSWEYAMIARK